MLTRRTLLKSTLAAGAYAGGLGLAGYFGGIASAKAAMPLVARRTEALITDKGPTKGAMTYGEAEIPPVLRMRRGELFNLRLDNQLDEPTTSTASAASSASDAAATRSRGTFSPKNTTDGFSMPPHAAQAGTSNAFAPSKSTCASPSAAGSAIAPTHAGLRASSIGWIDARV